MYAHIRKRKEVIVPVRMYVCSLPYGLLLYVHTYMHVHNYSELIFH